MFLIIDLSLSVSNYRGGRRGGGLSHGGGHLKGDKRTGHVLLRLQANNFATMEF